jgi:hypothetical protein
MSRNWNASTELWLMISANDIAIRYCLNSDAGWLTVCTWLKIACRCNKPALFSKYAATLDTPAVNDQDTGLFDYVGCLLAVGKLYGLHLHGASYKDGVSSPHRNSGAHQPDYTTNISMGLTSSTEHSPSREANRSSGNQEIPTLPRYQQPTTCPCPEIKTV